jgi:hypothetical protein
MTVAEELECIAEAMDSLESKYVDGGSMLGFHLPSEEDARARRLVVEAKALMDEGLGIANDFSLNLVSTANSMRGISGGISLAGLRTARELVSGAAARAARKAAQSTSSPSPAQKASFYVAETRISELKALRARFDMTRLVRLCEELNLAHQAECHMTKAMVVRAIADHVPPIFGCSAFAEVANNYAGSKSFRGSMQHLQSSLRHIADSHLHTQIRMTEILPTAQQVDFAADLDALLAEVIRVEKGAS